MKLTTVLATLVSASLACAALLPTRANAVENRLEVYVDEVRITGDTLVDDFSGTTINFDQWTSPPNEYAAKVDPVNQNLVMISVGESTPIPFNSTQLPLLTPDLSSIQATLTVTSTATTAGSSASVNISGQFYNAGNALPTDQTGDIIATVSIGDRNNGTLEAWATILESTDPSFGSWNATTYDIVTPTPLSPNTPYEVRLEYNTTLDQFTFTVDGTVFVQDGPDRRWDAFAPRQFLSATSCCDDETSIQASVDDLRVGNRLVDDFSSGYLRRSVWDTASGAVTIASRIDPSIDDKLLLFTSSEDIAQNGRANADLVLGGENPDRIEAVVSISRNSSLPGDIRGRFRLNGYAYNERRDGGFAALPYNECDDEIWVQVQIKLEDGELRASADSQVETVDCDTKRTLIDEDFAQRIRFDTDYLLWIERDGNTLTLGLDNESFSHSIDTPIYDPNQMYRRLNARIQQGSDEESKGDDDDDCFIATAAYGSALHPKVKTLRDFRDQHLLTNSLGTSMVKFYYRHSPPIADYLRERDGLRATVRVLLAGVIYSVEYPLLALLLLVLALLASRRMRNKWKATRANPAGR